MVDVCRDSSYKDSIYKYDYLIVICDILNFWRSDFSKET